MARHAAPDDVWTTLGQQQLADGLTANLQRTVSVDVVENRLEVTVPLGGAHAIWTYEAGGEWTVQCPWHASGCATPFVANGAAEVVLQLTAWARTHA